MNTDSMKRDLIRDEGSRLKPYFDTVGKCTIGVGRNLTDKGISSDEQDYLLEHDIAEVIGDLDTHLNWWQELDEVRQRALANMCFNLGITKLLQFKNLLTAVQNNRFDDAMAEETRKTPYAHQVGIRAERIIHMFLTGTDP